jgi:sodium-dependent phosphate transporter
VWDHYKKSLSAAGIMGHLMFPVRACLYGVYGPGGKERIVRAHNADSQHIQDLHNMARKYDDRAELVFRQLQMLTSIIACFSHGSNDVANAMGPFSTILGVYNCDILKTGDARTASTKAPNNMKVGTCVGEFLPNTSPQAYASATAGWATPDWILAFGGIGIGLGFLVYGYHLMRVLGNNLTYHSPSRGYCMEFGAAVTVLLATRIGLPISTTQCITGATMAIGLMSGLRGVNWKKFGSIFLSWLVTMPLVGIYAGLLFAFMAGSPTFRSPSA